MAIKTIYIGSEGPFKYDDTVLLSDPDGLFPGVYQNCIVTDGDIDVNYVKVITLDARQVAKLTAMGYYFGVM